MAIMDPCLTTHSVRATNVYEENSLGIYPEEEDSDDEDDEKALDVKDGRVQIWGKHLMRHLQRQLSFGICFPASENGVTD